MYRLIIYWVIFKEIPEQLFLTLKLLNQTTMKKSLLLLALTLCFSSVVLSQGKNRISVFSGVLHNYADASKMINLEYTHHSFGVFHGILINSVGVEFKHYSANNLWWSASVQLLDESNGVRGGHFTNAIIFRSHLTSAITLGKTHSLTQRLSSIMA